MDLQQGNSLSSSQRAIPLVVRPDIVAKQIEYQGVGHWVIKNPVGLKYFRLRPEQYQLLLLLDGIRTLEEIRESLLTQFPTLRLQLTDLQQLVVDLYEKGLVYSSRLGQGASLLKHAREQKWKKFKSSLRNVLYLKLPGWDPYTTLNWLYPYVRWWFHPAAVVFTIIAILAAMGLLLVQFDTFRSRLPEFQQFFSWPNLMYLWLTLAVIKVLHEFGHGLSCKHFGGECHEIGIMFLVFSPTLYCDVSDSWMLRNKWQRISIGGAGMYVETMLSAIAIFAWWNTQPGLLNYLCLNVFFVTTITTVIFNANPLMRFDGYYMLADLLEIPNLRPKADKLMRDSFSWHCLGIESRPDPFMPETGRVWFVTFAIAAWFYRWFILLSITYFLYTVLKPYGLQSIGIMLALVSMGSIFFNMFFQLYRIVSAPRVEPMSRIKITTTLVVLTAAVGFLLAVKIPLHIEAPFLIEPYNVRDVYTTVAGELVEVEVKPGQTVKQGQVLARLVNFDMEEQYLSLKTEERSQQAEIAVQHALENWPQHDLAKRKLKTIQEQLADYKLQIADLTIKAPCDGVVVSPPRKPGFQAGQNGIELGTWFGTPLDQRNRHSFLDESTHIASISPRKSFQAILLVDQGDRRDISRGQQVELKLEHLPDQTYVGSIEDISPRHLEYAPEVLSNKLGGDLSTVTDASGREHLASVAYQAKVRLDEDHDILLSNLRGRARVLVTSRTTGDWIWQYILRTFHFRL